MSPDNENAVMSQQDIDAMVSSASDIGGEAPAPAQAPVARPAAEAAPGVRTEAAATAPGPDSPALADVAQRLARLEAAVARISQGGSGSGQLAANVQELAQQLQAVTSQVNEIVQYLPNTLGYGVRSSFQCGSCGAQGLVATPVTCTHCGTQTAIGWWPQT